MHRYNCASHLAIHSTNITRKVVIRMQERKTREGNGLNPPSGRGALSHFVKKKKKKQLYRRKRCSSTGVCVCVRAHAEKESVGSYRFDPNEMGSHWNALSKGMK